MNSPSASAKKHNLRAIAAGVFFAFAAAALGATGAGDAGQTAPPSATMLLSSLQWLLLAATPPILALLWYRDVIRPGSFQRLGPRPTGPASAVSWGSGAALTYCVLLLAVGVVGLIAIPRLGGPESLAARALPALVAYALAAAAAWAITGVLMGGQPKLSPGTGGGPRRLARDVAKGLCAFGLAIPIIGSVSFGALLVYRWLSGTVPDPIAHDLLRTIVDRIGEPWTWGLIASAVVGAPIVEEFIYRRFLQTALLKATGRTWPAIMVTAALFSLVHLAGSANVPIHALATLFALGVGLGIVFERSRSLVVPIVVHMAFNASNIALAVWGT